MKPFLRRYGDVVLACGLALIFIGWPQLDLELARYFYEPAVGFPMKQLWWVVLVYNIIAHVWVLALIWLLLLMLGYMPRFRPHLAPRHKAIAFLLVVLLIGPGLLVDPVLKDHWGRARPRDLVQFGGNLHFTPALSLSNQCRHNCSFVSGHAAAGFYPMVGYWVTRRRRWLAGGITLGLFVGYIRMVAGAHFLSDIVFAGVLVHFTCRGLATVFRLTPVARHGKTGSVPVFRESASMRKD